MDQRSLFFLNLIGIGFLLTQNRYTVQGIDGNATWAAYMVGAVVVGAVVAGAWALLRKPSRAQSVKHFLYVGWAVAGLLTLGSYQ